MIVCSCAVITSEEIHRAIAWMRAADPDTIITPGKVYRALGKRPDCGGCITLFVAIMRVDSNTAVPVDSPANPPANLPVIPPASLAGEDRADLPAELRGLRATIEGGVTNEG